MGRLYDGRRDRPVAWWQMKFFRGAPLSKRRGAPEFVSAVDRRALATPGPTPTQCERQTGLPLFPSADLVVFVLRPVEVVFGPQHGDMFVFTVRMQGETCNTAGRIFLEKPFLPFMVPRASKAGGMLIRVALIGPTRSGAESFIRGGRMSGLGNSLPPITAPCDISWRFRPHVSGRVRRNTSGVSDIVRCGPQK